jgi:predicted O-methyltransferase YrrM
MIGTTLAELQAYCKVLPTQAETRPEKFLKMPYATDRTGMYYRFFHASSLNKRMSKVLELGTHTGTSAAHLAANPSVHVTTVDTNGACRDNIAAFGMPNITSIIQDSIAYGLDLFCAPQVERPLFDTLYIDTDHNYDQMYKEYTLFRNFVVDGGTIFFDDIHVSPGMEKGWGMIPEEKIELPELHYTGFGAVKVKRSMVVEMPGFSIKDVIEEREMRQKWKVIR